MININHILLLSKRNTKKKFQKKRQNSVKSTFPRCQSVAQFQIVAPTVSGDLGSGSFTRRRHYVIFIQRIIHGLSARISMRCRN